MKLQWLFMLCLRWRIQSFFEFLGEIFFSSLFGGGCDGDPDGNPGQEIPESSEDLVL